MRAVKIAPCCASRHRANAQRSTLNAQRSTRPNSWSRRGFTATRALPRDRRLYARGEDTNQFDGFINQWLDGRRILHQRDAMTKPQPSARFAQFLVTNANLVDEIVDRPR